MKPTHPLGGFVPKFSLFAIGLLAVLPFLYPFHLFPNTSFYNEWIAFALGIAACFAFLTTRFWRELQVPHTGVIAFAFLLLIVAQGLWIERPYTAQIMLPALYLAWAILLMVVAQWLSTQLGLEKVITTLAWFFLVGGLLQGLTGLVQYLGIGGGIGAFVTFKQGIAVHGNIAQSNHFAAHLTLGAIALIYLYNERRISIVSSIGLLGFFAFMALLAGSRSVFLYAFAIGLLSYVAYKKRNDPTNLRLCIASLFFLAAYICSRFLLAWIDPWLLENLATISDNEHPFLYNTGIERLSHIQADVGLRTSEWQKVWRMFLDAPLFGVGADNYGWHSFSLQSLPEFSRIPRPALFSHSHNLFAQVLAETGIAGLAIVLALIVGWVRQFMQHALSPLRWFVAATLLVLFIHSNLEFPLWYSYFLGIAAVMLGLTDTRVVTLKFTPWLWRVGTGMSLLLVALILTFTLIGFNRLSEYPYLIVVSDPQEPIDPREITNMVQKIASNPILEPYAEVVLAAMMPASKVDIEHKLPVLTRVFRRNPSARNAYKQASFLALSGRAEEAKRILGLTAKAYPDSLSLYIEALKKLPGEEIQLLREEAEKLRIHKDEY